MKLPEGISRHSFVLAVGFTGLAAVAAPWVLSQGTLRLALEILLVFSMAQAWNLLAGYAGLVSFGHQAFIGIGAYALFMLSNSTGLSPYLAVPFGAAVCGLVALLVAPFLFRLRDALFSIGMWVFAEALRLFFSQWDWVGRSSGVVLNAGNTLDLEWFLPITFWWGAALALGSLVLVIYLLKTRFGLGLMAVRDDEYAAAGVGVDVWSSRLLAFAISSAICGAAGAINYMSVLYLEPGSGFDPDWQVKMLFVVIVGGIGTIEGPFVGTLIYFVLRETLSDLGGIYLIILGAMAAAVMMFAPRGVWAYMHERFGFDIFPLRRYLPTANSK